MRSPTLPPSVRQKIALLLCGLLGMAAAFRLAAPVVLANSPAPPPYVWLRFESASEVFVFIYEALLLWWLSCGKLLLRQTVLLSLLANAASLLLGLVLLNSILTPAS